MVVIINMFYYDSNFHHDYTWYNYSNGWQLQVQLVRVLKKKSYKIPKPKDKICCFSWTSKKKQEFPSIPSFPNFQTDAIVFFKNRAQGTLVVTNALPQAQHRIL